MNRFSMFYLFTILFFMCSCNGRNNKVKEIESDILYNKDRIISLQQENLSIQTVLDSLNKEITYMDNQLELINAEYDKANEFQLFRTTEEKGNQLNALTSKYNKIQNEISEIREKIKSKELRFEENLSVIKKLKAKNERLDNSIDDILN